MSFARRFWDGAYQADDHLLHWQGLGWPVELAVLVAARVVDPEARVVDLGCGAGRELSALTELGLEALGLDFSLSALALARADHRSRSGRSGFRVLKLVAGSVTALPLADASVGFVFDRGCFHTLSPRQRRDCSRELARVIQPGGCLLLWGAAQDDEEAGLLAVDETSLSRFFPAGLFTRGPLASCALDSRTGVLAGHLALLHRRSAESRNATDTSTASG